MSTKRVKRVKRKYSGHKYNYMDNLSGKQWVKQVKISGMASKRMLKKNN